MNYRPASPSLGSEKEAQPGRSSKHDDVEAAQRTTDDSSVCTGAASGTNDVTHSCSRPREMRPGSLGEANGHSPSDIATTAVAVRPGEIYNPRSLRFWAIMGCNFLALFLVALDRTILATAVPRITDEFHSLGDVGWYASSYMLTTSASQLLFGRIYKFYPTKWTFLVSIVVFEIGSAICGAAPSSTVFIVGRSIAGLASAGIFTGCMLMFMMVPLHKRPMFQGLFGMTFGVASVMGPLVGGAFTGSVTWRWCFYMNLPIGLVAFVFMVLWWTPPEKPTEPAPLLTHFKRLDPLGSLFFLPAVVSLLLALEWGGSTYSWSSGVIIGLLVACAALVSAFTAVQILRPETATIPARIIRQRSVLFATLFTFFIAGGMLMCVYFLPIWFQTAQEVDPLRSGIYTLPLVLSLVVSSAMSGIFTSKIGYYMPSMLLCPVVMAIGEGLMSTFSPTTASSYWIGFQFLTGFGLGFGMQTGALAIQTVLPMADVSTGIAINMFAQQLGGAVFTSVGQAILSNVLVKRLVGIGGLQADTIIKAGITNLLNHVPHEDQGVVIGAYNFAVTRIFLAAMGLSCGALLCALFMEWRSIKKPQPEQAEPRAASSNGAAALRNKEGACLPNAESSAKTGWDGTQNDALTVDLQAGDSRPGFGPVAVDDNLASEAAVAEKSIKSHSVEQQPTSIIAKHTNGLVIGVVSYAETTPYEPIQKEFFSRDTQSGSTVRSSAGADDSDSDSSNDSFVTVSGNTTLDGETEDQGEALPSGGVEAATYLTPDSGMQVEEKGAIDAESQKSSGVGKKPDMSTVVLDHNHTR